MSALSKLERVLKKREKALSIVNNVSLEQDIAGTWHLKGVTATFEYTPAEGEVIFVGEDTIATSREDGSKSLDDALAYAIDCNWGDIQASINKYYAALVAKHRADAKEVIDSLE